MARPLALTAALAVSLLAVSGAGGAPAQQTLKRGGTVYLPAAEPPCLNFLVEQCHEGALISLIDDLPHWVLGRAFEQAPNFTFRPLLVSGVEYTKRPPFTLTYRIRPQARWSDGVPVSAQDFVFTHRAIRKHHSPDAEDLHLTHVRAVRAVDPKTVRVTLTERTALWRSLFPLILPRHALRGMDLAKVWLDRIDNPKTGRPIGTGPFLVERWERGRELVLVRNPRYWRSHAPYLDRIVLRFIRPGDVPPDGLLRGELHVDGLIPSRIAEVRRTPGISVVTWPTSGFEHFAIRVGHGGHPALQNKLVRQALGHAIDRVRIVREVLGEISPRHQPSDSAVFHNESAGYEPNWNRYRYDPARARRLLERAGCRRDRDGIFECGGRRLSLRFVTTAGRPPRVATLELAQRQLFEVGIEARPAFVIGGQLFNELLPKGEFDVALFAAGRAGDPTSGLVDSFGCGGPLNLTGYCQRLLTADLSQSDRILDSEQRARVLNRADRRLAADVPVIPLFWVPEIGVVRTSLRNYVPGCCWRNAENWWLDR